MAALLDVAGAEEAIVGGLSLGLHEPRLPSRPPGNGSRLLLIIDTGPGYRKDEAREGWNQNALRTAERFETEGLARLAGGSAETRASSHLKRGGPGARRARDADAARRAGDRQPAPDRRPLRWWWSGPTTTPFLIASDYMAAKIPGARKLVIPGAGHAANIDQPEAFNTGVLGFLAEAGL